MSPAKKAFRTRRPSKTESWSGENESIVGDTPQNSKVEDVKTKLSCETSFKKGNSRCENEALVPDFPPKLKVLKVEDVNARHPSKSDSWRCENEAFPRDSLQIWKLNRQTGRQTDSKTDTHTHTLAQNCHCEFCCEMHLTCKTLHYTWQERVSEGTWQSITKLPSP
mgnify:CR=1 FL=1